MCVPCPLSLGELGCLELGRGREAGEAGGREAGGRVAACCGARAAQVGVCLLLRSHASQPLGHSYLAVVGADGWCRRPEARVRRESDQRRVVSRARTWWVCVLLGSTHQQRKPVCSLVSFPCGLSRPAPPRFSKSPWHTNKHRCSCCNTPDSLLTARRQKRHVNVGIPRDVGSAPRLCFSPLFPVLRTQKVLRLERGAGAGAGGGIDALDPVHHRGHRRPHRRQRLEPGTREREGKRAGGGRRGQISCFLSLGAWPVILSTRGWH